MLLNRKCIEIEFKEIKLRIKMPSDMDCHCMAIRGLWLAYDHYSIGSNSYWMSKLPEIVDLWNPTLGMLCIILLLSIFHSNCVNLILFIAFFPLLGLFEYSIKEYDEKIRIGEEQAEGRRLRLKEKKAILEKLEYPSVPRIDKRKRARKPKKSSPKDHQTEFESMLTSILPSKLSELLPYLPTPNEIILEKEGTVFV